MKKQGDFVKKTVCDKLVQKFNAIQTNNTSNLVEKADYNIKITEIKKKTLYHDHDKYNTTKKFNKLMADTFSAKLVKANLTTKTCVADLKRDKSDRKRDRFW